MQLILFYNSSKEAQLSQSDRDTHC